MKKKTICILGVDGCGKTSIINSIKKTIGDNVNIQYMGFKNFETKIGQYVLEGKVKTGPIIKVIAAYYEMIHRYRHALKSEANIVIFDRYVWERYVNNTGVKKCLFYIIFYALFPKPNYTVYLYTDISTSLSRKDDIIDIEKFKIMKKRFDNEYLKKTKLSIDTSKLNISECALLIIRELGLN